MTDEEIEIALKECNEFDGDCSECSYRRKSCQSYLHNDALDYIDRLKAACESLEKCTIEQHGEIHRLRDELKQVRKDTAKEILKRWWRDATVGRKLKNQNEGTELWYIKQTAREFGVEVDE